MPGSPLLTWINFDPSMDKWFLLFSFFLYNFPVASYLLDFLLDYDCDVSCLTMLMNLETTSGVTPEKEMNTTWYTFMFYIDVYSCYIYVIW